MRLDKSLEAVDKSLRTQYAFSNTSNLYSIFSQWRRQDLFSERERPGHLTVSRAPRMGIGGCSSPDGNEV